LLLAGLALFVLRTEPGARLLWQAATRLAPSQLSGEVTSGTLAHGISLRNVTYQTDGMLVKIDQLTANWRTSYSPFKLDVRTLSIGTANITLLPTPPSPLTLPHGLSLPLAIGLQNATLQKLIVQRDVLTIEFSDVRLSGQSDGTIHVINLEHVATPVGKATASLRLNGKRPFPLNGAIRLDAAFQDRAYQLDAALSGSLQVLGVRLQAAGEKLSGVAVIEATPFSKVPFQSAKIDFQHLDPQIFNAQWPHADLDLHASLMPTGKAPNERTQLGSQLDSQLGSQLNSQLAVAGSVSLTNAQPGPIDRGLLPLVSASARIWLDAQSQQLEQLKIVLPGAASLAGNGILRDIDNGNSSGNFNLRADKLNLHAMHSALVATALSGPITLNLDGHKQQLDIDLTAPTLSATAKATFAPQQITLQSATLRSGKASVAVSGTLARDAQAAYALDGNLSNFNPAQFFSTSGRIKPAAGDINLNFQSQGALRPELRADLRFKVGDSRYAGLPMTGNGHLQVAGKRLLPSRAELAIAGNALLLDGSFGAAADRLSLRIDAPALAKLGFGLAGSLNADGQIGGSIARPIVDVRYKAQQLAFGDYRVATLAGEAHTQGMPGDSPDATVKLDLRASGVEAGITTLRNLNAGIDGTYARHVIRLDATGTLRDKPLDLHLAAQGKLREQQPQGMTWNGTLNTLENRSTPRVSLASPLTLAVASGSIDLGAARLSIAQAAVALQSLHVDDASIRSVGSVSALNVGHLLELRRQFTGTEPPIATDLVLDGSWNVTLAERADGFVQFERSSGDVRLPGERSMGLSQLEARVDLRGTQAVLDAQAAATRIGSASVNGQVTLQPTGKRLGITPRSPLTGRLQASIPRLQTMGDLFGPRISLGGNVDLDIAATGTVGDPRLSGNATGEKLSLTMYDHGIRLRDGNALIQLEDNVVVLQELLFHGGDGTLRASGRIPLDQPMNGLSVVINADHLQGLSDPSAKVTFSGRAQVAGVDGAPRITGNFTIDRALLSLPETAAPKLGNDVVVIRGGKPHAQPTTGGERIVAASDKPAGPFSPSIDIQLDLGNNFRFVGSGADLLLGGALNIVSAPGKLPQAFGTVGVIKGVYEAFDTKLAIERGVINFTGPMRNPNLNILAMRRGQEVEPGVQVTGTVQQPRVQLVSQPNVPDEEKLSWLVFGRSPGDEVGPQTSLGSTAAAGLLNKFGGKRLAEGLGLDAVSIGSSEFGMAGRQVVNLGKEVSDRLHIGFEQSLTGTESVLKLTYEMSQHWSVVVRGGSITGMDVFYSKRFDSLR